MRGIWLAIGFLATGLLAAQDARAEDDLFDFLFGPDTPSHHRSSGRSAEPGEAAPRQRGSTPPNMRAGLRVLRIDPNGAGLSAAPSSGGFCVRTCDGYYFPLIPAERATRQKSCEYACPSAPMAIYYGSTIEDARNYRGEKYTSLKTAFSFRDKATPKCACNRPENSQAFFVRIARSDPTLHSGDIIYDRTGAYVYGGNGFTPAAHSALVPGWTRERLRALLERARVKPRAGARQAAPGSTAAGEQIIWAKPKEIDKQPISATPPAGATSPVHGQPPGGR
jgi:hypothetical protein